ncbi:MAG TPA: hypothetical protein VFE05_01220 [Longimicrobiaceae bacterium]|jgi:hypothetical protein|nr:hypothetical protein [Longimicrobiaceae bacterium]
MRLLFRSACSALLSVGLAGCHAYVPGSTSRIQPRDRVVIATRDGRPLRVAHADGSEAVPGAIEVRGRLAYLRGDTAWLRAPQVRSLDGAMPLAEADSLLGVVVPMQSLRVRRVSSTRTLLLASGVVIVAAAAAFAAWVAALSTRVD